MLGSNETLVEKRLVSDLLKWAGDFGRLEESN
jgi:hypothetical protein